MTYWEDDDEPPTPDERYAAMVARITRREPKARTYHGKVGMRKAERVRTIETLRAALASPGIAGDRALSGLVRAQLYTVEHGYWPPLKGVAYDNGGMLPRHWANNATGVPERVLRPGEAS